MTYTLDSTKQASWRTHPTSVDFYLFLHTPSIVFMAQANMPPATYPLYLFLYDNVMIGDYTNLKEDMMLLLGTTPGGDDLGRVRIRKNLSGVTATSSIIYIQRSSQGILDGEIDMQNDAYVTVLDFFPLWSIPQLIDSNGIMYEDSEIAFSDVIHLLPVANAGVDFLDVLESVGSTVQKTFGENASYATAPGATISSWLWTFPDGQTSSSATPTITFTANTIGYYSLAVTDSLGNVKTSRRFMAVVDKNHPLLIRDWEITSHVARPDGQEMSIIIHDPIPYSQYIDGIEGLISMRERRGITLGGLVGSTGFENMIFAGYLGSEDMRGEAGVEGYLADTIFTLLDNAGKLKTLPGFTELKERESTTRTTWTHMNGANIDRYVVSILDHRSNAGRRMDIVWSGTGETYAFTVLGSDGGNLYDQADGRCQAIGYKLTCDRYGRLQMRPDPQLQAETSKTTDVIVPIRETDWSTLKRVYGRSPTTHWNWGESIAVSTANASDGNDISTFWNVSPGLAPGQGLAAQTSGEQLAATQDELNIRERHRYERLNNLFKGNVEVLIANDGYFCDPALMKWVQLEITSQHAGVRGRSWISTTRFLPLEMNYQYDHENGVRTQRIVLEKEIVTARKAVTYFPPGLSGFVDPGTPTYQQPEIIQPGSSFGLNGNFVTLFLFNNDGYLYYYTRATGVWNRLLLSSKGVLGTPTHWNYDAFCPQGLGTGTEIRGWLATTTTIYRVTHAEDPAGTITFTRVTNLDTSLDFSSNCAGCSFRILASERGTANRVICVTNEGAGGTYLTYTTDGTNWKTDTLLEAGGSALSFFPGVFVSGKGTLFFASSYGEIRKSTTAPPAVGTFAAVSGFDSGDDHSGVFHVPWGQSVDDVCYFGGGIGTTTSVHLYRGSIVNSTKTEITPTLSGENYTAVYHDSLASSPASRQRMVLIGQTKSPSGNPRTVAGFRSFDGGNAFENFIAAQTFDATTRQYIHAALTDNTTLFLMGNKGAIGFSQDFGTGITDLGPNLTTDYPGIGRFVGIYGA